MTTRRKITMVAGGLLALAVLLLRCQQWMLGLITLAAGLLAGLASWTWLTPIDQTHGQMRGASIAQELADHRASQTRPTMDHSHPRAEDTSMAITPGSITYGPPADQRGAHLDPRFVERFEAGLQAEGWDPHHSLANAALASLLAIRLHDGRTIEQLLADENAQLTAPVTTLPRTRRVT